MRFLLTAFEPFDGSGLNSSLAGCELFVAQWGDLFDHRFAVLPVEYGADTEAVERAVAERPPDVVLHTGQSRPAEMILVERIAVNVRYAEVSAGTPPRERPQTLIDPQEPPALFATLPVQELADAIRAEGVPAAVSNHAGIYLCNHVLYRSLLRASRGGSRYRAGFLHAPRLPEQVAPGEPAMPAAQIARAIFASLRHVCAGRA